MVGSPWRIRLSDAAERDFSAILRWTAEQFGQRQAQRYRDTLVSALVALGDGPDTPGSRRRDDILPGLRTLHVARGRRHGRHFIVYRVAEPSTIEVVRILHEAMDLPRHVSPTSDGSGPTAG